MNKEHTLGTWAENEVEIVLSKISQGTAGDIYLNRACYESSLKAFNILCEDGHFGFSINTSIQIMERLCHRLPLSPITDDDFPKYGTYIPNRLRRLNEPRMNEESIQCPRMCSLFKSKWEDGKVTYHDIDRVVCVNTENINDTFYWGFASEIIDELYPITVPYYPPLNNKYYVYVTQFTVEKKDVCSIDKFIEPSGKTVEVNRYFYFTGEDFIEIDKEKYLDFKAHRDIIIESKYAEFIINDIVGYQEDKCENEFLQKYGDDLWRGDMESEDSKYTLRDIWWMFMSKFRNNMSDVHNELEKYCNVFVGHKLAGWNTVQQLTSPVEDNRVDFINKHPEFEVLCNIINTNIKPLIEEKIKSIIKQTNQYCTDVLKVNGDGNKLTTIGHETIRNIIRELDPKRFNRMEGNHGEKQRDCDCCDCGC